MDKSTIKRLVTKINNNLTKSTNIFEGTNCMDFQKPGTYGTVLDVETRKQYKPYRIICEDVHGAPQPKQQVNHKCCNPSCCNPDHLEWVSPKDNVHYSFTNGNKNMKLSKEDIITIRNSTKLNREIALEYDISMAYVSFIKNNKRRTLF